MILKCVAIDDEPLARECIANYIREIDFLELVGSCSNPLELSKIQNEQHVDLVFLDVQMPRMNGIEFLKASTNIPMVILTTAFPNYALEGFELDVLDYLLKPITFTRFFKAASKVKEHHLLVSQKKDGDPEEIADQDDHIFIKCDHSYRKIFLKNVLFIESMQNYITFHTSDGKKHLTLIPLKHVIQKLSPDQFIQVHKSFVISITKIDAIDKEKIVIGTFNIPLSRNYRSSVMDKILKNKLWKK